MLLNPESFVAALFISEATTDPRPPGRHATRNSDVSAVLPMPTEPAMSPAPEVLSPPWRPRTMQEWLT